MENLRVHDAVDEIFDWFSRGQTREASLHTEVDSKRAGHTDEHVDAVLDVR